jgi:hypothetical protein
MEFPLHWTDILGCTSLAMELKILHWEQSLFVLNDDFLKLGQIVIKLHHKGCLERVYLNIMLGI